VPITTRAGQARPQTQGEGGRTGEDTGHVDLRGEPDREKPTAACHTADFPVTGAYVRCVSTERGRPPSGGSGRRKVGAFSGLEVVTA